MNIKHPTEEQIRLGSVCPYCWKEPTFFPTSSHVYGKDYGPIVQCETCGALVGCHDKTRIAKGRLGNRTLRQLKKAAHENFDPLWRDRFPLAKKKNGGKGRIIHSRNAAYKWLSNVLGIPRNFAHIGMLSEEECREAIRQCKRKFEKEVQTKFHKPKTANR
jgi:hypothetical protein